jgi:EpsD family peptidyl-prolyl cis-trans isomerase
MGGGGKASQSIARVNGDEITIHQLNNELQLADVQPEQQAEAEKHIVQQLVDRQILVQEAIKNRLDRDPQVLQTVENAKAEVLANAYLENKLSSLAKPSEAEIADYRAKHEDIFANRKIFVLDELVFTVSDAKAFQTLTNSAKSLEDVSKWLSKLQIKNTRGQVMYVAETLPPDLLDKLKKMVIGDLIFINLNEKTSVGRMIEIRKSPISESNSRPLIERAIYNQKSKKITEIELERLHKTAKIVYLDKKFEPMVSNNDVADGNFSKGL